MWFENICAPISCNGTNVDSDDEESTSTRASAASELPRKRRRKPGEARKPCPLLESIGEELGSHVRKSKASSSSTSTRASNTTPQTTHSTPLPIVRSSNSEDTRTAINLLNEEDSQQSITQAPTPNPRVRIKSQPQEVPSPVPAPLNMSLVAEAVIDTTAVENFIKERLVKKKLTVVMVSGGKQKRKNAEVSYDPEESMLTFKGVSRLTKFKKAPMTLRCSSITLIRLVDGSVELRSASLDPITFVFDEQTAGTASLLYKALVHLHKESRTVRR